jgi:hypothetical protein
MPLAMVPVAGDLTVAASWLGWLAGWGGSLFLVRDEMNEVQRLLFPFSFHWCD